MNFKNKQLEIAVKAARDNGKIFKKYFGKPGEVKDKGNYDSSLVTQIDLRIERNIRKLILSNFPAHKIIGEEYGSAKLEESDLVWIIDPIDGTSNFISGIPLCCICIGLWDKVGPLLGVVYNPITEELYTAYRGKGAFLNNKKISPSKTTQLKNSCGSLGWISVEDGKNLFNKITTHTRKTRVYASSAWQTCLVASGKLDFYISPDCKIWDVAAPIAILKEAGGRFTDFDNKILKINLKQVLVTNGKLHNEIINAIK